MQETKENLSSLNASSVSAVVSQNPMMNFPVLFVPHHQQLHDNNNTLQSKMTIELRTQLNLLQERSESCIKAKDNVIEEVMRKNQELEMRLKRALEVAGMWKNFSHEKTALCSDLASRLLVLRKRELARKRAADREIEEEAESSTCDNGDDDVDTASTSKCKRRRF